MFQTKIKVSELSGGELCYWVEKANFKNGRREHEIIREHYNNETYIDPRLVEGMRDFIRSKYGEYVEYNQEDKNE